jgi:CHAT domain-containing protein
MKAINGYDPAYARARSGETSDLGALQEALDRAFADCLHGCAVLEYYALDEELLVWLLAPQRAPELTRMPIRQAELWGLAERWREALGHPPDDRRGACAEDARLGDGQLRDRLLPEDVRTRLRELPHVTHLCIVPNDILADVPFAALGPPGGQLSERYSLSVADSAAGVSALLAAWEGPRPPPPEASVMGVVRDDPGEAGLQQWVLDGTRAVAAVCGCDAETGAGVTARRLLEALADRGIVHLTCHGEVDDYDPMESGILLSDRPPTDGEPVAVGVRPHRLERLTARHIADAEIAADLVFVNACESGRTTRDLSEEPLGLTRALIWAGAKSAIGTLWPVHGKAASYLAETFYRELRKGHYSKAEALAAAQRSIAASPHWADPYYWASYVLVGQWA